MDQPVKILAIQFKYFGDTVFMIPALRAIRERWPGCALHALVPEEVAPILNHLPWLNRVWPMPRRRGRVHFKETWPIVRALRSERFERSVDFGGNDRGAILSLLCGARHRLGPCYPGGFIGRPLCYTQRLAPAPLEQHESVRLLHILSGWGIAPPATIQVEIHTDAAQDAAAALVLPRRTIICHLTAGKPKKEWPIRHWAALYQMAAATGLRMTFTTGKGAREESLVGGLKELLPDAPVLSFVPDLGAFLSLLKRGEVFISGDTGPLHFAAGLGVPTLALFGPTSATQWAPIGARHHVLIGSRCDCDRRSNVCHSASHCLAAITPEQVFTQLQKLSARANPR